MRLRQSVRGLAAAVGALSFAFVGAMGTAAPAHASATGSTALGTFTYEVRGTTVKVPVGCFLTHSIEGSGKKIESQMAGVDCIGVAATFSRFCNWRIDFAYADTDNRTYRVSRGATRPKCEGAPLWRAAPQTLPHYGKACARLFVNGKSRATQCHYITR
ncbi:hypothetical protein OG968_10955 [Streptomyces althioticus]|uniref:hypothetical protein n=1 Tax=Streptomyces althioticus TaxID=83380 RepID=UPI003872E39B|nr:hypothetical protein OG968_10955 [Streptomyces althioticus]